MGKGHVTSATVVPTTSEQGEISSPRPDQLGHEAGDDEVGAYSSDEEDQDAGTAAVAAAPPQADVFLQAAFNGQGPIQAATLAAEHAALPVQSLEVEELAPAAAATKPSVAPLVSKAGRQRSLSAVVEKKKEDPKLTKNYTELVKDFRQLRPYTRQPDGSYPLNTRCIFCAIARPTSVFFPCQHMSVCNDCIYANNMSPDYSQFSEWCVCPVCMTDIRLILPHSGSEEDKYWKWVMEVKPQLPAHFKQSFKESGKRLRYSLDAGTVAKAPVAGRRGSIFQLKSSNTAAGRASSRSRRHTWQAGADDTAAVQHLVATNEDEVAKNCVIL